MKVYFYINSLHQGGAQRVINNLASMMANDGFEVAIVTSFIDDKWEYSTSNLVSRINLNYKKSNGFIIRNIKLIKKLRKVLKRDKPDYVISFMGEPNIRLIIASFGIKIKKIISVRNDPNKEYPNFIFRFLARSLFKQADKIVFQTKDAMNWFPKKIKKKGVIIYNQVDKSFYNYDRNKVKNEIVTVGRLTKQKNQILLIKAFEIIKDRIDANLLIFGDGELYDYLQDYINKNDLNNTIYLKGQVNDIPESIGSSKLFVLTSDFEGMPNALMEAMALGIPCISTDCPCGGPKELFGEELTDFLVDTNDINGLSQKIIELYNDDKKLDLCSKLVKEKASCFDPDIVYKQWKNLIR